MQASSTKPEDPEAPSEIPGGPSWRRALALILAGLLVAAAVAYRLVAPFFPRH
ncbi:MAG TPA: hypothetical protein VGD62_11325 [Acidobacteriaceae bacterium]